MPTGIGETGPTEPSTGPPPTQLDMIEDRLSKLEDALYMPAGVLHALFAALDQKAAERHEETMRTLTTIANGVSELSNDVAHLKPKVEAHDARLHLLRPAE